MNGPNPPKTSFIVKNQTRRWWIWCGQETNGDDDGDYDDGLEIRRVGDLILQYLDGGGLA